MTDRVNRQWRLAARPEGLIKESDFEWAEEPVGEIGDGQVLVRTIYLSLDPANRGWVRKGPSYVEPVEVGEVMRGLTVGVVEASRDDRFAESQQQAMDCVEREFDFQVGMPPRVVTLKQAAVDQQGRAVGKLQLMARPGDAFMTSVVNQFHSGCSKSP